MCSGTECNVLYTFARDENLLYLCTCNTAEVPML